MKKILSLVFIVAFAALALSSCGTVYYENADLYAVGDATAEGEVKKIKVYWSSGEVNVVYADTDSVSVTETASRELKDAERMRTYLDGDTFVIRFEKAGIHSLLRFGSFKKTLTLTLPRGTVLEEMTVDAAAANVKADALAANALTLKCASGDVTLGTVTARTVNAEVSSGNITAAIPAAVSVKTKTASGKIDLTLGEVTDLSASSSSGSVKVTADRLSCAKIDVSSGSADLTVKETLGSADLKTSSGNVYLTVPETLGATIAVKTASGNFLSELPLTRGGDTYVLGDGTAQISLSSSSGNVHLKKP